MRFGSLHRPVYNIELNLVGCNNDINGVGTDGRGSLDIC